MNWIPRTAEDRLLYQYWRHQGGELFMEIPIGSVSTGQWPKGSKIRRIDGVRLQNQDKNIYAQKQWNIEQFKMSLNSSPIEVIEAKQSLDRYVIGQALAGVDMFEREYGFYELMPVVVCAEADLHWSGSVAAEELWLRL